MTIVSPPNFPSEYFYSRMVFSKSFGYSIRGILYVAMENEIKSKVPLDEIAQKLKVPRHFLGKVMKRLVKEGIIDSKRGPAGGFCLNERTLETRLITIIRITETEQYDSCVLRLRKCNSHNPCPLHEQAEVLKTQWHDLLAKTTINELLKKENPDFIRSIAAF